MPKRFDVDRDLSLADEELNRVLEPLNRHWPPARRFARPDDDLIAFDAKDPVRPPLGQRLDLLSYKR
jgi:hypothetical protein